ncbi:thioredoxin domain-containing protein [Jatrophihabitans telluris]|uniref:Thioredoxin domain-containing protein n=1 Tax=Jatrophihabitans telluris TaxID=2038343 RepID=A0ABY4R2D7_9ACTN|nr:thioredoxin domain-containing protein [Jatrophihabitans telluris]UQX89487.1 thioredoxin domain-containing protein [Jatrophihabitans telluris]
MNRLGRATSPYLLQHQDNPVDWWEWGEQAFAEARRRDVPILLSVGYAACHWCHVMAHESFEDDQVAAVLNAGFVAIKVDREERPDVDAIYMSATTALTGHGGWPMTCVLTSSGEPFFAGTYLPKPNFLQLLGAVTEAWSERREELLQAGSRIVGALQSVTAPRSPAPLAAPELDQAEFVLAREFDSQHGGLGSAPKFPPSMVLEFLLRQHARTGEQRPLDMVTQTCDAMARGGIYDQLAGGFARYSVDAEWVVPHFEKMLYDNAQLLRVYLHLYRATGSALALRVVGETADFLLADLGTTEGGFASALDADTDGVEGLTYVWNPAELVAVLGAVDGVEAAAWFGVTDRGTFEHGRSTLQLPSDPGDPDRFATIRRRLALAREDRPQPARDDKVVTAWNGLAIAGLAEAGALLKTSRYLHAAQAAADFLLREHVVDGRLRRSSRAGIVGAAAGVAEDYGDLAEGLLSLHQADGTARWLRSAGELLDVALRHFAHDNGGFFDTADDAETLFTRPADPSDNAAPGGQSALAGALLTYSALTGSLRHRQAADAAVAAAGELAVNQPRFAGWTLAVAEASLAGPLQVAVVGGDEGAAGLIGLARASTSPGLVLVQGEPDAPGIPLLADRPRPEGRSAAYVCRGFVCDRPVTTEAELHALLNSPMS